LAPVLAILSALLYSGSMIMARIGFKYLDTFSGVLISMGSSFLASLVLVIFFVPLDRFTGWALLFFVLSGLSGPCIGRFMLFVGIKRVGSSTASTLYSIKPLFSAIAAVLILGEHLTLSIGVATVIMVCGLAIISTNESNGQIQKSWSKIDLIFPIAAGAAYGISNVLRKIGLNINYDPLMGVVAQNVTALIFSLPLVLFRKGEKQIVRKKNWGWAAFVVSGFFSVLGQLALFQALALGTVVIVSPLSAISPLFVIAMAIIFLRQLERVTWKIIVGALLIISGTLLLTLFPNL
jgi:DME family drug/metabolite transporter